MWLVHHGDSLWPLGLRPRVAERRNDFELAQHEVDHFQCVGVAREGAYRRTGTGTQAAVPTRPPGSPPARLRTQPRRRHRDR